MLAKITVAEAAQAASQAPDRARVELIGPFVESAARVIQQECGEQVQRGQLHRVRSPQTNNEVSSLSLANAWRQVGTSHSSSSPWVSSAYSPPSGSILPGRCPTSSCNSRETAARDRKSVV